MKCENCGENDANVRYTQIINGEKKEMYLCEDCSRELGIGMNMGFDMDMDIPSFFGEIFDEYNSLNLLPTFGKVKQEKCNSCGLTYGEFARTGRFGCPTCYDVFSDRLDPILKSLQGSNRHIGRKSRKFDIIGKISEKSERSSNIKEKILKNNEIDNLKKELKEAVKEERYEDAAKLRDKINELENKNK